MLRISDLVYGIFMLANSSRSGRFSTSRPPYITAISSVWPATTPRSWVTRMTDMLRSCRCSPISSRICACTVTSSAVVGSSANSSVGPHASAIAIITRWRMPPDSSCGYWSRRRSGSGMPHAAEQLRLPSRGRSSCPCRGACSSGSVICLPIFISGFSETIGFWKTIDISAPQRWRICFVGRPRISWPANLTEPSDRSVRAAGP